MKDAKFLCLPLLLSICEWKLFILNTVWFVTLNYWMPPMPESEVGWWLTFRIAVWNFCDKNKNKTKKNTTTWYAIVSSDTLRFVSAMWWKFGHCPAIPATFKQVWSLVPNIYSWNENYEWTLTARAKKKKKKKRKEKKRKTRDSFSEPKY